MNLVLRCFSNIANTDLKNKSKVSSPTTPTEQEIDYTINTDTSGESGITPNSSPRKRLNNTNEENKEIQVNVPEDSDATTIRLAANLIIGHFINFLGHFPQPSLGAARLSCLINENDDNLGLSNSETFDPEVLNAPNVLFFLINNSSIISFTELPEESSSKENDSCVALCKTPVRTIVRNLLGKFSWDCKQIHSNVKTSLNSYQKHFPYDSDYEKRQQNRDIFELEDNAQAMTAKTDQLESLITHLSNTSP